MTLLTRFLPYAQTIAWLACLVLFQIEKSQAQAFDCGSNGSYGAINIAQNATVTLQVPPDGVFHCTTVTLANGARLNFTPNALNTPVYIVAQGNVQALRVAYIDVSGQSPIGRSIAGGMPGLGGFAGGAGSSDSSKPSGAGNGPGGGLRSVASGNNLGFGGNGSYRTAVTDAYLGTPGPTYGNSLLIPLVGGSGGAGTAGFT
jgi:hypothetical protein